MKKIILHFCFLAPALCLAQQFSIDWHKISGGGGTGAGGNYSLVGTIGQHDASNAGIGGQYLLTGGFWAVPLTVQTPGAPTLYIIGVGGPVTIFWQNAAGWSLQQSTDLTSPAGWSTSSGVSLVNGTNYLSITNPPGNLFYRLMHP